MKRSIWVVLLIAVLFTACGCQSKESKLTGKWAGKTGSIEFFANNTGVINPPKEHNELPSRVPFKWDFVQKDSVRMVIAIGGGRTTFAKFDGKDGLVVEDDRFSKVQ